MGQSSSVQTKPSKKSQVIAELQKETHMSTVELRSWYEKFMEQHPTGSISKEEFVENYQASSPTSEKCKSFAEHVFNAYDMDQNGYVDVKEFVLTVNVASRGTIAEKLEWAFDLYDQDNDEYISREEAETIITSIYEMEGEEDPEAKAKDTTEELFTKLDRDYDDRLSRQEFINGARTTNIIGKLLAGC